MTNLIIIVFVLVILSGIAAALIDGKPNAKQHKKTRHTRKEAGQNADVELYEAAGPLLSDAELKFYRVLREVVEYPRDSDGRPLVVVMSKVRVLDLVDVKTGFGRSARQSAMNRIQSKHVDFVLVRARDMSMINVIELDDKSHSKEKTKARDAFVDSVYGAAGIPIVHVPWSRAYVKEEVAGLIRGAMGG